MSERAVEIRPEVAIYAAFARLNYRPWYALAEFVDNAVQSYLSNKSALIGVAGSGYRLTIRIEIGPESICIEDNAAGIPLADFPRAFLPASPPPDTSGLSEFGLGMKAAACWFARRWSVTTSALGEHVERRIEFDIPRIVSGRVERLPVAELSIDGRPRHGTTVRLDDLNVRPQAKTITKIKAHLASIYRLFLRTGEIALIINKEPLEWQLPELLQAPYFENPADVSIRWYREFVLELDSDHRVWGWAGLLARASVANAGFSVFRRQRLIEGSYGEAFRPAALFRGSNSYTYQRLVGELNVEGFSVSHTKDGVQWADWEEDILEWVRRELDQKPTSLLRQAEGFRARPPKTVSTANENTAETVAEHVERVIAQHVPPLIATQLQQLPDGAVLPANLPPVTPNAARETTLLISHAGQSWRIRIELISDDSRYEWLELAGEESSKNPREVHIRVNIGHPFMVRHAMPDHSELDGFVRLAAGLALAEVTARATGVRQAGTIRRNLNQLLYEALAAPLTTT